MNQKVKELMDAATEALGVLKQVQADSEEDWCLVPYPCVDRLEQALNSFVVKTYAAWQASSDDLGEFLHVGDCVDEELKMYILETLPPACMSWHCIQLGEPTRHNEQGQPMFITLERKGTEWIYTGIKATPTGETCLYI